MLIVDVNKSGGIEKALKELKRKFRQTHLSEELKERKQFTKKSVKKRATKLKAIHKEQHETETP